ncbi:MAG: hypothetical protein ACR2NM_11600 [Bythopirellula sp.]
MSKSPTELSATASRRKLQWLALGLASLIATAGCRSARDNQIDLLERELRVQEDYIYELEDYVVEYSEKLRDCRACPQQTAIYAEEIYKPQPAPERSSDSSGPKKSTRSRNQSERSVVPSDDLPAPEKSDGSPAEFDPDQLEVPDELDLEIGEPVSALDGIDLDATAPTFDLAHDASILIPDPVDYQSNLTVEEIIGDEHSETRVNDEQFVEELFADELLEPTTALAERVAERLEVTRLFHGEGGQQSPQSLLTVVEALDANDEPVDLNGEVSLMVMTVEGAKPQRVKRWNFTTEETVAAWQSSDLGDGLHLELPLEKLELPAESLELWVRLVTTDGRKLLTQLPFEASQLRDVASATPEPRTQRLRLAQVETDSTVQSINPLRKSSKPIPTGQKLELAKADQPDNQPRWRASMERTDRTSEGFATTSSNTQGWKSQAPGRQPYVPPRMATQPQQVQPRTPTNPVWSAGRR